MARAKETSPLGHTLPMEFMLPPSEWAPPTELPDLRGQGDLAIDLETRDDGLSAGRGAGWVHGRGYVTGVTITNRERSVYAPIRHPDTACLPHDQVAHWLQAHVHESPGVVKYYHNAPYDLGWSKTDLGVSPPPEGELGDTMAAAFILDENWQSYSLDNCCLRAGIPGKDEAALRAAAEAFGVDAKSEMYKLPARYVGPYAEQDGRATLELATHQRTQLEAQGLVSAYQLEVDLVPMVVAMRRRGIRVDVEGALRLQAELLAERDEALRELSERAAIGRQWDMRDVNSDRFLARIFDAAGVAYPKTAKGNDSFSADWMSKVDHWLPRLVTRAMKRHDAGDKFLGQYILGYADMGRIHAEAHAYKDDRGGTVTTRFSYSDPPLQQMPSRDPDVAPRIRGVFLPEPGELWAACDYCHDDQTEILTREGWVLFSELSREAEVAQWAEGRISWVVPMSHYVGVCRPRRMVHLHGDRQVDALVTPEHRMLLWNRREHCYEDVLASDLRGRMSHSTVVQAGVLEGTEDADPDMIRLVVALQADAADRRKFGGGQWIFYLKKERKIQRLLELLDRTGCRYVIKQRAKGDQTRIAVWDRSEFRFFLGQDKTFVLESFLNLRPELREVFLSELPLWDGKGSNYGSTNRRCVEVAQIIAVTTGHRAALIISEPPGRKKFYSVTLSMKNGTWADERWIHQKKYAGKVYCVTVPSGYIVTRRSGRVLVAGNSQQEYRLIVHFAFLCNMLGAEKAVERYRSDPHTDFHDLVASLTGLPRRRAKDVNFAKAFGAGVKKFALMTGMSEEEAAATMEQYDGEMPFVKLFNEFCAARAQRVGFLRLLDGARGRFDTWEPRWLDWDRVRAAQDAARAAGRPLPVTTPARREEALARTRDETHPWYGERLRRAYTHKAMNKLIQGSAARQTKLAMRAMWREGILPLIQMHDEVGLTVGDERTAQRAAELMRDVVGLTVPVATDVEYGVNWGRAAKIKGKDGTVVYGATYAEARTELERAS